MMEGPKAPTILAPKQHGASSVFEPANLLREARRQRNLPDEPVPAVCALDPDGYDFSKISAVVQMLVKECGAMREASMLSALEKQIELDFAVSDSEEE